MIKNFSKIKEQLIELAEVLNSFKSETVQVRLVELLLGEQQSHDEAADIKPIVRRSRSEKPQKEEEAKKTAAKSKKITRKRSKDRPGPSVILKQLTDSNYFSEKRRTISDIVAYCANTFNYQYKSTDLSGTLARLVKEEVLKREKNPETNQFEYFM
jgi:glutathione S-transferase